MPGLSLSTPDLAILRRRLPPATTAITKMVIEGDSQTTVLPDQAVNRGDFYSYAYADDPANADLTVHVRAQGSRTVGGAAYVGPPPESADDGTPAGNTLLAHRADDIAYGPQLITVMLGSNDLGFASVDNMMARWIDYAPPVRAAGIKLAVIAPPPYHPQNGSAATFNARWADYVARLRDPAIRATFADYYLPLGEHPDFRDPALIDTMFNASDKLHMTPGAGNAASGQHRAYQVFKAAVDTIRDAHRAGSTIPYDAAWPSSETNLLPGTNIRRRVLIAGIAHAGLSSGVSVSGPDGTSVALNGGPPALSVGTNSGNGYAIYNGDILDVTIPLGVASSSTVSIDLRIGGETRAISFTTTADVTPAAYAHQGIVNNQNSGNIQTFAALAFDHMGIGVLAVRGGSVPSNIDVGGVGAARRITQTTDYNGYLSVWTVPITATGAREVVVTFPNYVGQSELAWGVATNADAAVQQLSPAHDGPAPQNESSPHLTDSLIVPGNGIAVGFFGEYGTTSITPASTTGGTTLVGEGNGTYQGETYGIAVGTRAASGTFSFDFAFGTYPRAAIVFKALGT